MGGHDFVSSRSRRRRKRRRRGEEEEMLRECLTVDVLYYLEELYTDPFVIIRPRYTELVA